MLSRCNGQSDTERVHQSANGFVTRFSAGGQRFVQTLTAQARSYGNVRHPARTGDIAERSNEYVWIGVFQCGSQIFCAVCFTVQVVHSIEWAYWVIEYSPDQAHAPSRGLREYPVFGWIYFRLEAAHRPANRGECSTSDNQGRNESASQKRLLQWVPNPRSCRIRLT